MLFSLSATNPLSRRATRGYNLVEMSIVLGVVGLIIGGLWKTAGLVEENSRRERAFESVVQAVNNLRSLHQGRAGVTGNATALTHDMALQSVIPSEMLLDRSASPLRAYLPWGDRGADRTTLLANGGFAFSANGAQLFNVELRGLNVGACIILAQRLASREGPPGVQKMVVGATTLFDAPNNVQLLATSAIQTACTVAGAGATLEITYRLRNAGS